MKKKRQKGKSPARYNREEWLETALHVLKKEGVGRITVRHLSELLGVSTGSFYWHFKNRDEFIRALAEYWKEAYTQTIAEELKAKPELTAEQQLQLLIEKVVSHDASGYDTAMRAWAAQEKPIQVIVDEVAAIRLDAVSRIFSAMDIPVAEVDMRTKLFVVYMSGNRFVEGRRSPEERQKMVAEIHDWFTKK